MAAAVFRINWLTAVALVLTMFMSYFFRDPERDTVPDRNAFYAQKLTGKGLPDGIWGKVGVAVAPSDPRRVYALIEAAEGGLCRSDDGGETWSLASGHHALRQRAWYYTTLTVDPRNPDIVWFPHVPMLKTVDGGKTIRSVKGLHHADHHVLWIDPTNPRRMIAANDGGVDVSTDGGETWHAPMLPIAQLYHVATDTSVPYRVFGSMQDLGTASGPSNSLSSAGIVHGDWHGVGGGEAGHAVADPKDPNVVYAGEYLGILTRYDHRTRQARDVAPWPDNPSGHGASFPRYRFQWTAPIGISPHDPKTVYHGGNVLFRTTDGGSTWTPISGDLTRDDETKPRWSGGPITGDNTGAEYYGTIFSVAESPRERGLIWAGSDDGLVHARATAGSRGRTSPPASRASPNGGRSRRSSPRRSTPRSPTWWWTRTASTTRDRTSGRRPTTGSPGRAWPPGCRRTSTCYAVREDPRRRGDFDAPLPPDIAAWASLPGLTDSLVQHLYGRLGIRTLDDLETLVRSHLLRTMPGVAINEDRLLAAIRALRQHENG